MCAVRFFLGIAMAMSLQIHFGSSVARADSVISTHPVAADPICTIEDEAKCWSAAEVDKALAMFFCGNGGQSCERATLENAGLHAEMIAPKPRPAKQPEPAPVREEPKLDASGVPEFNAWEEGCD
jgi:hypothetical protein